MNRSRPADCSFLTEDVVYALETLVRVVERQSREFVASVLLLSDDGKHVVDAAGPSLPGEYRDAINGLAVGPSAGSCGTALYRGERVIVADIEADALWEEYRDLARPFGLAACWSQPILSSDGTALGTFALYYHEPRHPTEAELEIIEAAAGRAGLLLDQARAGAERAQLVSGLA